MVGARSAQTRKLRARTHSHNSLCFCHRKTVVHFTPFALYFTLLALSMELLVSSQVYPGKHVRVLRSHAIRFIRDNEYRGFPDS